jgi:hypothetical protein
MNKLIPTLYLLIICITASSLGSSVLDTPFIQEFHVAYPVGEEIYANDVRAVTVDQSDNIWIATRAGIYMLKKGEKSWKALMSAELVGPAFDVDVDKEGTVWIAAWNGIFKSTSDGIEKIKEINSPISAICARENEIVAYGPFGMWWLNKNYWQQKNVPYSRSIRAIKTARNGGIWIVTGRGLYNHTNEGFTLYQNVKQLLTPDLYDVDYASDGHLWIAGSGGITVYDGSNRVAQFTTDDGLPTVFIQSVIRGPDGRMWVGTKLGVTRYDGKSWSLRHSRRWLLGDDVRDIAFDSEGTAWIATNKGVSAIKQKKMNLAEKAAHYYRICMARHVRDPWLVEKCRLTVPGDTNSWEPRDDDNDGQYTSMYLVMESYRYAVTKSPQARDNARKAFEALRFLQLVTDTQGFVARTVVPATWKRMADPNRKINEKELAVMLVHNPREKRVEKLWRPSKDGKWLWKGDTSSDEITGHMYGYLFYHDLVADAEEKKRVSAHICRIVDFIIECGFVMKDIDGEHTKWAVWSPEKLNNDPDWRTEQGINSVEILSYLKLAYHVSNAERYQKEYLKLLHEHNYKENILQAKTVNPGWRTHIDDELLALAYPCLFMHENNPDLLRRYFASLDQWYEATKDDCSPFFNFTYGAFRGEDPNLKCSIAHLRDTPLDLVRWRIDNTKREDIKLTRVPEIEHIQTSRLMPPSEGGVMRWDNNPWIAVLGDGGHTESDGVYWLLSYWMGRYYGFIQAP